LYALTASEEWVLVESSHVPVNEQGGIGRLVVEGGVKAVAFEALIPQDEAKESSDGKGSPGSESAGGVTAVAPPPVSPHDEPPTKQFSLFDDASDKKEG
ncbi:hypothetical protein MXD63_42995, partial [Frankia sp. Cpl3]|nr:hypothetical protein [Frankia sp. Cpl3]